MENRNVVIFTRQFVNAERVLLGTARRHDRGWKFYPNNAGIRQPSRKFHATMDSCLPKWLNYPNGCVSQFAEVEPKAGDKPRFDYDLNPMYCHHNPSDREKKYYVFERVGAERKPIDTFTYKQFAKRFAKNLNEQESA